MFSFHFFVNNKTFKIIFCSISSALIIVSGTLTSNYAPGLIAAGLGLLLFLSPEYLIPPLFAAGCVNETGFILPSITAARYFSFLLMAAAFTMIILKGKKIKPLVMIYFIGLGMYFFVSALNSANGITDSLASIEVNLLVCLFCMFVSSRDKETVFKLVTFTSIVYVVVLMFIYLRGNFYMNINGSYQLIKDVNNNMVALTVSQAVIQLWVMIIILDKERFFNIVCLVAGILGLFLTFLLGSRSSLGAVVVATVALMIIYAVQSHAKGKKLALIIVLVATFIFVVPLILALFPNLAERFTVNSVEESQGTGRFAIWKIVIDDIILKKPLFGVGLGGQNVIDVLRDNGNLHSGAHNIFLACLAELGIVGTVYFFFGMFWIMGKTFKSSKEDKYYLIPFIMFIGLLISGLGENVYASRIFWVVITFAVWMYLGDKSDQVELKIEEEEL